MAGAFVLAGRQAIGVVVAEDQLEVRLADLTQALGLRAHDHALFGFARAGDGRCLLALDLDHAHAAGAKARQLGLVAERGHLDAGVATDVEDGLALTRGQGSTVDLDFEGSGCLSSLRRLGREQALGGLVGRLARRLVDDLGKGVGHVGTAPARRMGWQTPAGHSPRSVWASNSGAKYRIPDRSGLEASASRPQSAAARTSAARSPRTAASLGRDMARTDSAAELSHAASADAAGNRLAAGVVVEVARHERGHIHDAGTFVEGQQRAGAAERPDVTQRLAGQRRVERIGGQEATGGAAHEHGLERALR